MDIWKFTSEEKKVYNLNYYDHCQQIKFMCMHNGITYHGEKNQDWRYKNQRIKFCSIL